jgi:hypothetical protein
MTEPLDPAVHGVASTLTSLRTRTGLREERLHGTEVVLDTLTDLNVVKAMINAGKSRERAIVLAVQEAAGTLAPTMRIIADASLGLGLYAGKVPDAELCAQDVGQRRVALLRNWDRLHELQSVPPEKAPSLRALRLRLESEALTALAVALTTSTSVEKPTEATQAPNGPWTSEPQFGDAAVSSEAQTLLQTFQAVAKALRKALIKEAGLPTGWRRNLGKRQNSDAMPKKKATAVSTAYGIRTMLLLEDSLAPDLIPVVESLKKMAHPKGGYASTGQDEPSAEATATVLNALCRITVTEDFMAHTIQMEGKKNLGDFEKARPFILTTMLETSLLLGRATGPVDVLVDCLLDARRPYGDLQLWPENSGPEQIDPAPSVAHTARAVRALAGVHSIRSARQPQKVKEALDQAVPWLIDQRDLRNTDEFIERNDRMVRTSHFTAAWVVKALVSAGVPAAHPAVRHAIIWMGRSYARDLALWKEDRGYAPIWMTFDAIEALRLAYLAAPSPAWLKLPPDTA